MKFVLEMDCDNAAFDGDTERRVEVSRILRTVTEKLAAGGYDDAPLFDVNGNKVGRWSFQDA